MLLVGVGLNSSGDPDKTSCWELVLREEVRLLVRLSGGKVAGSKGSQVGIRLEVGVGLWLADSKLLLQGMHDLTQWTSLNWLFGVSCMMLMLSS